MKFYSLLKIRKHIICGLLIALLFPLRGTSLFGDTPDKELRWLRSTTPDDFFVPTTITRAVAIGLPALETLMQKLVVAEGDIEWVPRQPPMGPGSPRYFVQFCIKTIIVLDVVSKQKYEGTENAVMDNSLHLIEWWEDERDNVLSGREYAYPYCMTPFKSYEEFATAMNSAEYIEKWNGIRHLNATFKELGFSTINEMFDKGISVRKLNNIANSRRDVQNEEP